MITFATLYFCAMAFLVLSGFLMVNFSGKFNDFIGAGLIVFGVLFVFVAGVSALILLCTIPKWYSSETKAALINREYATGYTTREVFFAESIIEEIRQVQRKRIEATINVNSDK